MVIVHSLLIEIYFTMKNNDNELFSFGLELIPNELFTNPNICLIHIDSIFMSYQLVLAYFLPYFMSTLTYLTYHEERKRFYSLLCCVICSHISPNSQNTIYGACGI